MQSRPRPRLIYCAECNRDFARIAVESGWLYGSRLPRTTYEAVHFADQDWKRPDRVAYMRALEKHRPALATVLDWEREEQLPEVLEWAEEAAAHVTEAVLLIPKVVGGVPSLPRLVGGKPVWLAYSVPTSHGGSPLPLWELSGWPVHLLGGSPQEQMRIAGMACLDVRSVDGNMAAMQARKGRTWRRQTGPKGHWWQLKELGDERADGVPAECFRRSLAEIKSAWERR